MIPDDVLFSKTHEWVRVEDEEAVMGVSHFAQEQLGDLTFVEVPEVGATFQAGEELGSVESVKAASEIYAPVAGEVSEVNEELEENPGLINEDPYGEGWICRIRLDGEPEGLLSPDDYKSLIEEEAH
ncbi:glycine cleavage system protein GcvH [Desulfohalovibrio reitneri]|uniref:glycine cleavage system protein GcvH n=1 Tax=Desulfohalovibrio reitneri TaxID=1307759 RepID=UPI0004A6C295|nr:glycine cleavage system protein GcvH [Desulfohalovibrio reitneri]